MEANIIIVLSRVWGLSTGGISVVLNNVLKVTEENGDFDPEKDIAHGHENIEKLAIMGSETVTILYEQDQKNANEKPINILS